MLVGVTDIICEERCETFKMEDPIYTDGWRIKWGSELDFLYQNKTSDADKTIDIGIHLIKKYLNDKIFERKFTIEDLKEILNIDDCDWENLIEIKMKSFNWENECDIEDEEDPNFECDGYCQKCKYYDQDMIDECKTSAIEDTLFEICENIKDYTSFKGALTDIGDYLNFEFDEYIQSSIVQLY